MEIIIKIPKEIYTGEQTAGILPILVDAIGKGIPLPEHHGRLIDADTLEEKVEKHREMLKISEYDRDLVLHYTDVEMAPTIIEKE